MSVSLIEEDVLKLRRIMLELLERSEAEGCLVCDSGGYVLAQEGRKASRDPMLISALGAGVFAASRELARVLGEDEFSALLHQGEVMSIYLCAVDSEVLLTVVFSKKANAGLVKLYATPAAKEMQTLFKMINERDDSTIDHPERAFVLTKDENLFGKES